MPAESPLTEGGVHAETQPGSPDPQQMAGCQPEIVAPAEAVPNGGGQGTTPSSEGATIATRSCSTIRKERHEKMQAADARNECLQRRRAVFCHNRRAVGVCCRARISSGQADYIKNGKKTSAGDRPVPRDLPESRERSGHG